MALYRKYRPATFAEVVGQEHVTDPLSTALDTGRISHAYLFSGPRGCGKTSSARILARSLNCVEGPTSTPCGVCSSCVALGPGGAGNLDVIELDAASHGGVDDTRELRDRAFYAPAESRYRVFIVDEAHMVTTAGFNALLKIVEEPPAHLIFVFATTEPDKVLPTIRSRTHHYPFRLLPPATMRGLLGKICDQENVQVEESVYPLVIRAGGGSPRDSLSVLDQLLAGAGPEGVTYPRAVALLGVTDVALIDTAVEALAAADGAALFSTIDHVVEAGHDPRRFATDLLERLRDLILLRAVPDAADRNLVTGPGDVLDRMRDQATRIGPATLTRYAELLHEGLGDMRGATAPRLLLEVIAARMLLPAVSDAETATLQRLETLERRVASGPLPATAQSAAPAAAPSSAAPAAPAASGEPRRRGAEALAALRESRSGKGVAPTATTPVQPSQPVSDPAVAGNHDQPGQVAAPHAPAQQPQASAGAAASGGESAQSAGAATTAAPQGNSPEPARPAAVRPPEMNAVGSVSAETAPPAAAPQPVSSPAASATSAPAQPTGPQPDSATAPGSTAPSAAEAAAQPMGQSPISQGAAVAPNKMAFSPQSAEASGTPESAAPSVDADSAAGHPLTSAPESATAQGAPTVHEHAAAAAPSAPAATAGTAVSGVPAASATAAAPEAVGPGSVAGAAAVSEAMETSPAAELAATPAEATPAEGIAPTAGDSTGMAELSGADVLREIEGAWADIRTKVREFGSAALQALLSGGTVLRVEGQTIVFGHQHAPLAQRLSQPQNLDAVRSAVQAVLGRAHDIKWEVGGSGQAAAGRGAGTGPGAGKGAPKKEAPRFSRPSQAKAASGAATAPAAAGNAGGWGSAATPTGGGADNRSAGANPAGGGTGFAPPEDDIPLPDGPDLPDDPGPSYYSSVGYDGVPPATTEEEEREMLADAARPVPAEERRDPDEVALELLRSELGATPLEG
ncbi:DNA polymerase III subunit gamma and tau [Nocardia crassostreae]|uniref:DNA polymerase III subunit gamma and tau n=1 Tax=Nocardia crassostreae TaxID=53428 RepID=UPI0008343A22|nr:DNA polymerase III subunit gamma and tau [Nocardia crassostreae]